MPSGSNILPKGIITNEWEGFGESLSALDGYVATDLVPKYCTCGADVTYGKNSPLEFHSIDVCDLHIKVKGESDVK